MERCGSGWSSNLDHEEGGAAYSLHERFCSGDERLVGRALGQPGFAEKPNVAAGIGRHEINHEHFLANKTAVDTDRDSPFAAFRECSTHIRPYKHDADRRSQQRGADLRRIPVWIAPGDERGDRRTDRTKHCEEGEVVEFDRQQTNGER